MGKKNQGLRAFLLIVIFILVLTICHAVLRFSGVLPVAGGRDGVSYGWYYKPRTDGKQPEEPPEFAFIKNCGGIWLGDGSEKTIYLTFDAGYENGYTAQILDVLKEHDAPAAFFLVGHYVKANPELVRRMTEEGHLVCNHTANHRDMTKLSDFESFRAEIEGVEELFREVTGLEISKYFRPPEGRFSERSLEYAQQLGYKTVFWSFAYADWKVDSQPSENKAFDTILSRTHPGMLVLLHSTSATNAKVLDSVLTRWEELGYSIRSLDEFTPWNAGAAP